MTNTKTELLLKALGIQNVFWIDDKFYVGSNYSDEQVRHAIRRIVFGSEPLPDQLRDFQPFREGQDEVFFADEVTNLIERLSQIGEGNQLDVLMEEVSKNDASNEEDFLGDKGFEKVQELLNGSKFESLSFSDWNAKKDTLPADNATLYLIDFENKFDFGAPGIGGKDVLNYLSRKKAPSFSVILTHVCDPHSETAKADEIFKEVAQEAAATYRTFSVMSKKRITQNVEIEADDQIAPPLKRLAVTHLYRRMAEDCVRSLQEGIDVGMNLLNHLPVEDLEHAVFSRSFEEGVSEPEVISRILGISQRKSFFDGVASSLTDPARNYFAALTSLRAVGNIKTAEDQHYQVHKSLEDLRHVEIFDEGSYINPMCSPLACGDVFQKWSDGGFNGAQYVLLAAPCDLMVRDDGTRVASEGVLVSFRIRGPDELDSPTNGENRSKRQDDVKKVFEVPLGTSRGKLIIDFRNSTTVNLRALDFCVANTDGAVKFKTSQRLPNVLLAGWRAHFEKVKGLCEAGLQLEEKKWPEEYSTLCLFDNGFSSIRLGHVDLAAKSVDFKLKRQLRIRSPFVEAILDAYLQSVGRPAFEHSFAERRASPVSSRS